VRKINFDLERAQELLDGGLTRNKTANELGVHHSYIIRAIESGLLFDDYFPFDEVEDTRHLYQNFEWLWEESKLEEITNEAFDKYYSHIDRRSGDMTRLGVYVRDNYGDLSGYLRDKKLYRLAKYIYVSCNKCGYTDKITEWFKDSNRAWGLNYHCKECRGKTSKSWNEENQDKIFSYNTARREMAEALPFEYTPEIWRQVRRDYGWKCAVSDSSSVALDHFIPVALGHGGTYRENLIPLDKRLNTKKKHYHPSRLIEYGATKKRYNQVITNLARLNGLTSSEYKSFVDWCFANPRVLDEVKRDKRHSIEIWREVTSQQFPLPRYVYTSGLGSCSLKQVEAAATVETKTFASH
jgi:hypothetical protein